jgi:predicted DNA-binding transcriptional regulator AlpA
LGCTQCQYQSCIPSQFSEADAGEYQMERLLPKREVRRLLGDPSDTTLWRMCKSGRFPAPVGISPGRKGWPESKVQAWIAERIAAAA